MSFDLLRKLDGVKMPHDKNCRHLLDSLSEYIDGELGEELCQVLENTWLTARTAKSCGYPRKTIYLYQMSASDPEIPTDVDKGCTTG
jgi:hypothetical protein